MNPKITKKADLFVLKKVFLILLARKNKTQNYYLDQKNKL